MINSEQDTSLSNSSPSGAEGPQRIIIAGGGTGGHIFPAIAIANAIKQMKPQTEILFVGAKGKMEMEKVPLAGYRIEGLSIAGFNRSSLIKNIGLPYKLIKSFFQVRRIFRHFKPDAVVGVGGYSTFPVLRHAQWKGIANFIHESNSFAGKANILLGKRATKIFVASKGMERFFPKGKLVITGNPVRKLIAESTVTRAEAMHFFGLDNNKLTVLAVGGSLGARSINEALTAGLANFEDNNIQLIWQTGRTTVAEYKSKAQGFSNIWIDDFITQMEMAYAAADVVISRSGAMAVSELCVAKKPVIFVPFPFASEDHQTVNAQALVNEKAALMIKDSEAKEKLVSMAITLIKDEELQKELGIQIARFAVKNADEIIAREILVRP